MLAIQRTCGSGRGPVPSGTTDPRVKERQPLSTVDTTESRALALTTARAAADKKAVDVRILDVGNLLGITDFFVIASATNDRQLRTVAEEVERAARTALERRPRRREGEPSTGWLLLDFGDVVVHAFTVEQREYYGLERLWSDAPRLTFDQPATATRE